jgi:hypothetical protein
VVERILNVRLVADEIAPNILLAGDRGRAIDCVISVMTLTLTGDGARGDKFSGVDGRDIAFQLLGVTALAGVQSGVPGAEDELETGGRFRCE